MQIIWSKTIEDYAEKLKLNKLEIEDTYNKPDKNQSIAGVYVSVKFYNGYAIIITFFYKDNKTHIMNAYKIYPNMITVNIDEVTPIEILENFMNNYGMEIEVEGIGKIKIFYDEANKKFYQGILNVEKYIANIN